jgi:hypothetical protein
MLSLLSSLILLAFDSHFFCYHKKFSFANIFSSSSSSPPPWLEKEKTQQCQITLDDLHICRNVKNLLIFLTTKI